MSRVRTETHRDSETCRLTCKFDMELVFRFEDLNIKGAVWGKVLHRPGSQDGLMVLVKTVVLLRLPSRDRTTDLSSPVSHRSHAIHLVTAAQDETSLGVIHPAEQARSVSVRNPFQTGRICMQRGSDQHSTE